MKIKLEKRDPSPKHINDKNQAKWLVCPPKLSNTKPTIGPPSAPPKKPTIECKANLTPLSSGFPLITAPVVNDPESSTINALYIKSIIRANQKLNQKDKAVTIDPMKHIKPILLTTLALSLLIQYLAPYIDAKIPKNPINPIELAMNASVTGV